MAKQVWEIGLFPKEPNWRIVNWHIATDTLIVIIEAQGQNLPKWFKQYITRDICDKY